MRIVILDAKTLGEGVNFDSISSAGELTHYSLTAPDEIAERIRDAEVVIVNKIRLNESNLCDAKSLKLICVAATGYDNIDIVAARELGITVIWALSLPGKTSPKTAAEIIKEEVVSSLKEIPLPDQI